MFLSMLVAWMIPDVPRSLREQLKKENMMLMEFLLNQDQEAHVKSHTLKGPNPCFPAHIDIVVEVPPTEQEEAGAEGVEAIPDGLRRTGDSDPEDGRSLHEVEECAQEESGGKDDDEVGDVGEKEKELNVKEEDGEELKRQEGGEEQEDKHQRGEEEEEEEEVQTETCSVDLDSFMNELGLLGENRPLSAYFHFSDL